MSDWYKDYNIKAFHSMKSGEAYCKTDNGLEIDKDNDNIIYPKTFAFLLKTQVEKAVLLSCVENIEKLYLLLLLKRPVVLYAFNITNLIKLEGSEIEIISEELVEDIASLTLDEELRMATKDKEIYFFKRLDWQIDTREDRHPWEAEVKVQARFNFLVSDGQNPDIDEYLHIDQHKKEDSKWEAISTHTAHMLTDKHLLELTKYLPIANIVPGWGLVAEICKRLRVHADNVDGLNIDQKTGIKYSDAIIPFTLQHDKKNKCITINYNPSIRDYRGAISDKHKTKFNANVEQICDFIRNEFDVYSEDFNKLLEEQNKEAV